MDGIDLVALDCDGVLWHGNSPVAGAQEALSVLKAAGKKLYFVSNNSQYTVDQFTAKVKAMGFGAFAERGKLWNSCMATQRYLEGHRTSDDDAAFVIGSDGLKEAVANAGIRMAHASIADDKLEPMKCAQIPLDPGVKSVIVGFDRAVSYVHLALAVRYLLENAGCKFIVTNRDFQFPAGDVRLPGTGAIVSAIETGARRPPDVITAKPSPLMLQSIMAEARTPPDRVLMVGDLWSDVAFGHRAGTRAALVLSGVTSAADAAKLTGESSPDAVFTDVRGTIDAAHVITPLRPLRALPLHVANGLPWLGRLNSFLASGSASLTARRGSLALVSFAIGVAAAVGFAAGMSARKGTRLSVSRC